MEHRKEVVYAVTVRVDESIAVEWLTWMQHVHIPEVLATGCFAAHELRRLLEPKEAGRATFEIRYLCASQEDYRRYQEVHASRLQSEHTSRYGGRIEASRRLYGSMETRS